MDIKHLLFSNRSNKQILVKNSFWLGAIELGSKMMMFIATVGLVRYWGIGEFGAFNLAFSYVAVFMILGDFGLSTIFTREVARHRDQSAEYLSNLLGLKLALSGVIGLLVVASLAVINRPVTLALLVSVLIFNLIQGFQGVFIAVFQAWEKMEMVFVNRLVYYVGALVVALVVICFKGKATTLVLGYIMATLITMALGVWQVRRLGIKVAVAVDFVFWKKLVKEALPLLGMTAAAIIYVTNDTLLIGRNWGNDQVGLYQSAYKILFAFQSVNVINYAIFPRITILLHENKIATANKLIKTVVGLSLLGLIPLAVLITFEREMIMKTVYGPTFVVSAGVMSLLVWAGVINYFRQFTGNLLVTKGKQKGLFYAMALGMAANLTLNYFLIPKTGFIQAGWSMVISELVILVVTVVELRR